MTHTKAGDLMIEVMQREGWSSVCTHDGIMAAVGNELWPEVGHPLDRAAKAGRHLRRDSRFENRRIKAHNIKGHPCVLALYVWKGAPE